MRTTQTHLHQFEWRRVVLHGLNAIFKIFLPQRGTFFCDGGNKGEDTGKNQSPLEMLNVAWCKKLNSKTKVTPNDSPVFSLS